MRTSSALAIELLAAAQAVEFLRSLEPGVGGRAAHDFVRTLSPTVFEDRPLATDIERLATAISSGKLVAAVERDRAARVSVRSVDALVEELCGDLRSIRAPRGTQLNALVADGGAASHAPQQPRSRGGGAAGGAGRLRRHRQGGAKPRRAQSSVRSLLTLGEDETLLVQSGKPVGVFTTHAGAPRVLIANALLVPRWATWEEFRRLEDLGLTMFGQMTAGSWIYIGTQGILQGTYQTFAAAGDALRVARPARPDDPDRGLGGMGGAQPLAATMAGAAILCVEVDPDRIRRRETRYLDEGRTRWTTRWRACARRRRTDARCRWRCSQTRADVVPELARRGEPSTSSRIRPRRTIRSTVTSRRDSQWTRPPLCERATKANTSGAF